MNLSVKNFLRCSLTPSIEKITYLSSQNIITTNSEAKTVRLDVLVKDDIGTSYDIEMSFPIDTDVYRKRRVLPFGKTSLLLETSGIPVAAETDFSKKAFR